MVHIKYFFPAVLFSFLFPLPVAEKVHAADLYDSKILEQLANDPIWKQLLVYEKTKSGKFSAKSAISSPSFFLSDKGSEDPHAELKATIEAFFKLDAGLPNEHAQCVFRARYIWLNGKLELDKYLPQKIDCSEYDNWTGNNRIKSLSVVYATGYLGNPASYYGHLLLKLNGDGSEGKQRLEDVTVNFGAIVPENESMLPYVIKGLVGSYDAGFTHHQYFYHSHNYGQNELRNLWEYELDIGPSDVELILAHIWELREKKYRYFFLNKNCAYRMAEIISLANGIDVVPPQDYWVLPQTIIQNLSQNTLNDENVVLNKSIVPSRQSILYEGFKELNVSEREILLGLINREITYDSPEFISLKVENKYRLLDVIMDYYQYMITKNSDSESDLLESQYRLALSMRFTLPAAPRVEPAKQIVGPESGRKASYSSFGVLNNNSSSETAIQLHIRPAYYDELDYGSAHVAHAGLAMGELSLLIENGRVDLHQLSIVNVKAVNSNATGLPNDSRRGWMLNIGAEQFNEQCSPDCLVPRVEAGTGLSWTNDASRYLVSGYVIAGAQKNIFDYGVFDVSFQSDLSLTLSETMRAVAKARVATGLSDVSSRYIYSFHLRKELNVNSDIRLALTKNEGSSIGLTFGHYW